MSLLLHFVRKKLFDSENESFLEPISREWTPLQNTNSEELEDTADTHKKETALPEKRCSFEILQTK